MRRRTARFASRRWRGKMSGINGSNSWIIVNDPLEQGGFHPDAKFSEEDVVNMLRFRTFTLGTILRHRIFGKFKVMLGERRGSAYRLVNSRYIARAGNGQKLKLQERPKRVRARGRVTDAA
jgi:hypothetical protein